MLKRGLNLKKVILISLAATILITSVFVGCAKKNSEDSTTTTASNLESGDTEIGFEKDENGEEVAVVYENDKDGKTVAYVLGKDGNKKKDDKGKYVTVKTDYQKPNNSPYNTYDTPNAETNSQKLTTTTTVPNTATTKKDVPITKDNETTKFTGTETVPKTSAKGEEVNFSTVDQATITSMLEVPYLYLSSYENSDGVPIDIACRVAVWMAEREGATSTVQPSGPVVLNLFRYFGQTVVNFKTQCNQAAKESGAPIVYTQNDTFNISEYTAKKQTVTITKIEDLGDNNFYKITADVKGCDKDNVVAIVQKNNLERSLGFSVKALKWS